MSASPSYDLALIQELVGRGDYHVTHAALVGAKAAGCDECDIPRCVLLLTATDLYKTMGALRRPGFMQDVYHIEFDGRALYVKLQLAPALNGKLAVVISFKDL